MSRLMTRTRTLGLAVTAVAMAASTAALAHHSFSMFDKSKEKVLDGTVSEFRWVNPHTWILLKVTENGRQVEYTIETPSPSDLSRRGWTRTSLNPGDQVKITINPLRNGTPGGSFVRAVFPNGRTLTFAN